MGTISHDDLLFECLPLLLSISCSSSKRKVLHISQIVC